MAGCTSNEAPVTDEGLWKDARPTGASLPYPRDTPTIIARHRTAGTSQQDDLGTAVAILVCTQNPAILPSHLYCRLPSRHAVTRLRLTVSSYSGSQAASEQ